MRTRAVPPPPTTEPIPAPAPSTLSEAGCGLLRKRYVELADTLRACAADADCIAEPRGPQFAALDGCTRYRRRDSSTRELDPIEQKWMHGACVSSVVTNCTERAAQCLGGRCVERPPEPIPRDWKRIDAADVFTFFAPPDLVDQQVRGMDSMVGMFEGPLGVLEYDYGAYSDTLEGNGVPGRYPNTPRKTRGDSVLLAGQKARLVTYRGPKEVRVGVYFPHVPTANTPWRAPGEGENRLQMSLVCKIDCEKTFLLVAHSLEFY